ncbi:hypothetical protein DSL72_000758 [Monilinia vaccinii-corymbosi]|uniref:Arabinan endo-1,5-alpha-L-arabinosidase n=1 Tax=Monilinia vaccinii-corymbosi TaxID=61207 RepID=A0A8A3NZX0_9HELO|nr:hypothetical protein DSL72_000758 [Monilinia vaccinii-corymbosi]
MIFSRLLLPLVGLLSLASAYANPGACTGECFAHDPSVIERNDGTWFKFNTGKGVGIWKSPALSGPWKYVGDALNGGSTINHPGKGDIWAPDVSLIGSTYYMYYALSTFGTQDSTIGVASSSTMEPGSWTDHGAVGISSSAGSRYNAIDPNLIRAGNDYLITFGSFWNGIHQVKMASPLKVAGSAPYDLAFNATGTHSTEGAFMFFHDKFYYLLFSSGICCGYQDKKPAPGEEYKIVMCRSASAEGVFVDRNNNDCRQSHGSILLASHDLVYGPGGQGVLNTSKGPLLYYHYANLKGGIADKDYILGYNYLNFDKDGWPWV